MIKKGTSTAHTIYASDTVCGQTALLPQHVLHSWTSDVAGPVLQSSTSTPAKHDVHDLPNFNDRLLQRLQLLGEVLRHIVKWTEIQASSGPGAKR